MCEGTRTWGSWTASGGGARAQIFDLRAPGQDAVSVLATGDEFLRVLYNGGTCDCSSAQRTRFG